ncbi:hypothetical protein KDK95_11595 [Actinospica sp. MGRD01-02]|uniref:Cell wall protein n=1 Tax=Actinospica acidithermotolerans TaxID=2828514 RepID=A0A941IH88_9ACTN|nr:hypothetical protein [Actinospica acidithermotolerans]MBR7826949.1 hypothetical protein [Actinospica acidithermotolerans]
MVRRVLCCTVALLAALGVPAGYAYGATVSPSCSDGNLSAANVSGTPTSVKAGAAIVDSTRLTNTTAAVLSNASFILALLPPPGVHGGTGAPALSWRVDGGAWHAFGLTWMASAVDWQSQVQYFGATFAPKAAHTLDIRTEFTTASPSGEYQYDLAYSADPCSMNELGMNFEYSQYAQGWTQPKPSPSTYKTTTSAPTHEAVRTSAATTPPTPSRTGTAASSPSPSPSADAKNSRSASAMSMPSDPAAPSDSAATLTGTQDTAASQPQRHGVPVLDVAVPAALLFLGGGLYARRRFRRR